MNRKRIGRRDFVKTTLSGCGGLFLLSSEGKGEETKVVDSKGKERKFVYRTLGKTGLKLPVINMGVMNSDNPNLIRPALDSGVLLLDTAHAYMQGRNEEVIGGVVKGRPRGGTGLCGAGAQRDGEGEERGEIQVRRHHDPQQRAGGHSRGRRYQVL